MRTIFVAIALAITPCAPVAAYDAGSCYAIGDADMRAYCLARARQQSSMCYAIQRSDLRAQCLAEVRQ